MIGPARRAAFATLLSVARQRLDSATALDRERRALADPRDMALALELVSGTLRWQAALDAALDPLIEHPGDLDVEVRVALRLGAYQRLFLSRIPAAAAVNDAVSLVREAGCAKATGLVNAVLRRLTLDRARAAWPRRPSPQAVAALSPASQPSSALESLDAAATAAREEAIAYLATMLSHPQWLVTRWLERHGFDAAEAWARFDNLAAPITLWPVPRDLTREVLAARLAAEGVATRPARLAPHALEVTGGQPLSLPVAGEGLFFVQDEASQLVAQLAVDLAPMRVLDLCASPGGKATYIRTHRGPGTWVIACDSRPRRIRLLRQTLARARIQDISVVRADATGPPPFAPVFDLVLLDAPCSGLGTIRRDPEIRWYRQASDLQTFAAVQQRMITSASACVRPGGHLFYATCSSEPEENEQVVDRFLATAQGFRRLEPEEHPWLGTPFEAVLDARADLRTLPYAHGLEAFYAAVLRRV